MRARKGSFGGLGLVLVAGMLTVGMWAQQPVSALPNAAQWTVKAEWVRAHEEFLASDVMAGRGSATRDEEIAATYVASEFEGYGLKQAPGMSGYLQSARVVKPELAGHAVLAAGGVVLREGSDFSLLFTPGVSASGPLRKVRAAELAQAAGLKGAIVLVQGEVTVAAANAAARLSGAAAVLVEEDATIAKYAARFGGKPRISMRLEESVPEGGTMVAVSTSAAAALAKVADGASVSLELSVLPETAPRRTYNAIGYLPGSDAASGTILLTAHLDHLGVGRPVDGDAIYNGANDDAAGTTAVLELAHALAAGPRLRRSVLFVCYGSEEAGELGSTYFGGHSPVPLKDLVANLEFEMIGTQDPKMPKGVLLFTGWDRSNLGPMLKAHGALLGPDPYPEQHFFERSDNYALALKGVVAHTAAGWGTPPTYHQPSDDLAHLDFAFMLTAIQSLIEPVRWLADSDFKPAWNAGGQPKQREQ